MRVDTLEAYNIPADILAIWREQVGAELLPVQERAVKEYGLFGRDNLIVFSPTSSGKTFVGELEQLVESVPGVGLRLNVDGACVLGLD